MRVFNGISIQLDQLVNLKQWMVSQGDTPGQDPRVIQEGLLQLYVQIDQRTIVLHVELYTKSGSALHLQLCVSNVTNKAIYAKLCYSKIQSTTSVPSSKRNTRGSWHGRGRGGKGHGFKHAVYEAETTDTSKPIVDATKVDIVKLLQAHGMVPTEGSELKH